MGPSLLSSLWNLERDRERCSGSTCFINIYASIRSPGCPRAFPGLPQCHLLVAVIPRGEELQLGMGGGSTCPGRPAPSLGRPASSEASAGPRTPAARCGKWRCRRPRVGGRGVCAQGSWGAGLAGASHIAGGADLCIVATASQLMGKKGRLEEALA